MPRNENKISTFNKICRIGLLWFTCLIWITLRAFIKTLAHIRKWWICRMLTVWSGLKEKWAIAGEYGLVETKWYDKKWFITTRKILLPIDLAVHIVVGAITAPFKFIKSFFMGFRTAARITKDIYSDKPNEHCYSNGGMVLHTIAYIADFFNTKNKQMFKTGDFFTINNIKLDNVNRKVSRAKLNGSNKLRTRNIWESSIPVSTVVNKPIEGKDKSIRYHIQTIMGLRSMKSINEFDQHPHGDIPRFAGWEEKNYSTEER